MHQVRVPLERGGVHFFGAREPSSLPQVRQEGRPGSGETREGSAPAEAGQEPGQSHPGQARLLRGSGPAQVHGAQTVPARTQGGVVVPEDEAVPGFAAFPGRVVGRGSAFPGRQPPPGPSAQGHLPGWGRPENRLPRHILGRTGRLGGRGRRKLLPRVRLRPLREQVRGMRLRR